jgi:ribonuclease HII
MVHDITGVEEVFRTLPRRRRRNSRVWTIEDDTPERVLQRLGTGLIAGVDEAGRGPLAGPVVAAAVIMPPERFIAGVDDSKRLSPASREEVCRLILDGAVAVGIGIVEHDVIDQINILNAAILAMNRAVSALGVRPDHLLVDGNRYRSMEAPVLPFTTVIGGDARCYSIAAASIVAKVRRDAIMREMDLRFPGYGFARHKGYPTGSHRTAIGRLGLSPIHRRSFTCKTTDD